MIILSRMDTLLLSTHWSVILILLPLAAGICSFLSPRFAKTFGITTVVLIPLSVAGLGWQITEYGVYHHVVGGWNAPLGIELYADGLTLLMLIATAVVALAVSVYSLGYFRDEESSRFWPLWLILLAALNALFLSADLFNLYVTLELLGLSAVALTSLTGDKRALNGAMRYLMATLLGSLVYLLGVALLYHNFGSIDIHILAERIESTPAVWAATGLMTAGLALKTALYPFHFWLPPAHANAPAPVSAVLSALVVKASFYILLRLWLELFSPFGRGVDTFLGLLGAIAILWGSLQAWRQSRLKLMIAYSTVAQIGYLFLVFPLAFGPNPGAWTAAIYLLISHSMAKAAMFLSAGNLLRFSGHDRIADLDRTAQRLPLTVVAFALAGVSIMGLPPSGGFIGKWLLLESSINQGRWDLTIIMILGSLLAAAYIFKVLGHTFTQAPIPHEAGPVSHHMEWAALLLAFSAILLGFLAPFFLPLMLNGNPFGTEGSI